MAFCFFFGIFSRTGKKKCKKKEKGKPTYNTRLRIDHTYPEQKSYVFSLYTLFGHLIDMEPVIIVRKADPRTGKIYKSIYVRTLRFPCLNEYHSLFYKDKSYSFKYTRLINTQRVSSLNYGRWVFLSRHNYVMHRKFH